MKKEDLLKIEGMTEELAEAVANASAEELKNFIPKTRFDEVNEAKKNAEALVKERDKQIDEVKASVGDNEELKKQIETLQAENKAAKADYEANIKKMQIDNAVNSALVSVGAKNATAVRALLKDLDKAEFDESGEIKGLKEQLEALSKSEAYLFKSAEEMKIAGATPAGGGTTPDANNEWTAKLAEARKNGSNLDVIAIKNQAAAAGVILM